MKVSITRRKVSIATGLFATCAFGAWQVKTEIKLHGLLQRPAHANVKRRTPQQREAWSKQNNRLAELWIERNQRDVAPALLQLLQQSGDEDIKRRVVRALGRLESAQALPKLQAMAKKLRSSEMASEAQNSNHPFADEFMRKALFPTLPLSIGRIEARNLKGQAKLNAVAKSVGLSWSEVVRLSQKVNAPKSYAQGTPGDEIVEEVVDVLYHLGKQKQNAQALAKSLKLSPAQNTLIQVAPLSTEEEIRYLVDYFSRLKLLNGDNYQLIDHTRSLGSRVNEIVTERLLEMKRNPQLYPQRVNYKALFNVASGNNEQRSLKLLKQFEQNSSVYIREKARAARERMESKRAIPNLPA